MVRPYSRSPRQKHRPFPQSHGSHEPHGRMQHPDHYGSHSRDQRELREGKAAQWRQQRGGRPMRGRPLHFTKGTRFMDEWRDPAHHFHRIAGQWRPQGRFHEYGAQPDYFSSERRGPRRHSPPRSGHSPPPHHRQPIHTQGNGLPAYKRLSPRVPFHGPPPGQRPPSPHHFHGGIRQLSPEAHRGPYKGPGQHPGPPGEERSQNRGPCRDHSPGKRLFDHQPRGERWNGGFLHPRSGERHSPQRKSQEFHRRGSYPERFSPERESRRHSESERELEENRRIMDWGEENSPHHLHRCPKWKTGSPSSSPRFHQHHPAQERPMGRPLKRKHQERRPLPSGPDFDHCAKQARREVPQHFHKSRGFTGHSLSLKDKSRLLKGRKLTTTSETGHKQKTELIPNPKHAKAQSLKEKNEREEEEEEEKKKKPCPSIRKARPAVASQNEQPDVAKAQALKKRNLKKVPHKMSCSSDTRADSPRETETLTIKVDTRHALTTHSSSPLDRQLSQDLVTVSRRGLGSTSEEQNSAHWSAATKKTQTESFFSSHGNITLNERFSKLQNFSSSCDQRGRYSGLKRQVDVPLLKQKTAKPVKIMGPPLRPSFRPSSPARKPPHFLRRPFPEAPGHFGRFGGFKRPLMAGLVARPAFPQRPMFRKSQSIMSKYRQLQVQRYRGPAYRRCECAARLPS